MPYRKIIFTTGEIYHVYNRSIANFPLFLKSRDYQRFLETAEYYRNKKPGLRFSFSERLNKELKERFLEELKKRNSFLVEIYTFALMPNHIHFLLKQIQDNGIADFMRNLQNSYAKYFNTKYNRSGAVFQALFKAVRIETQEQLIHVSRYIHLNPVSSFLIKIENLVNYRWNSFRDYIDVQTNSFIKSEFILENFSSIKEYEKFVKDQASYQQEIEKIKHLALDKPIPYVSTNHTPGV